VERLKKRFMGLKSFAELIVESVSDIDFDSLIEGIQK
jgi:hypothetical protein